MSRSLPAPRLVDRAAASRGPRRRRSQRPALTILEGRPLLSMVVPIPASNPRVQLSSIFWNGEARPLNTGGLWDVPSPASVGAAKTITITNNGSDTIYPFLRGENGGKDPNATSTNQYYDPQDIHGHEFRQYIGYRNPGGGAFLGLPEGASITIQVPLALWDGDNLYIATDGRNLTTPAVFAYDRGASIAVVGSETVSGTTWVQASAGYAPGVSPLVMFYYSGGEPKTLPTDAPAQLVEITFRDQYLTRFITDPAQTFPLVNYDVSYVNNMVAPISMEASNVPITYQTDPLPAPPTYYGLQDYGWLATDRNTSQFSGAMRNFINNAGTASVGSYFGGRGWPQYYNPASGDLNIPSGANLFDDSPLTVNPGYVHLSSYDSNRWLLTSSGDAPITAGGGGYGVQGTVNAGATNVIYLNQPSRQFVSDLQAMLKAGTVNVAYPGSSEVLATVFRFFPNPGGRPYVTLSQAIPATGPSGAVFGFTRTATDYAVTAITNLWYSWAQYHVNRLAGYAGESIQGTLTFNGTYASNEVALASTPTTPLELGMTVSGSGVPAGTTILKIVKNTIYLSQIPDDSAPKTQVYTFGKPQPLRYDPAYTTPYAISFDDAARPNADLFAAAVYEAMAVEATVAPLPGSVLPYSAGVVSQVIKFWANLPGYDRVGNPTAPVLVGQVRDVVKSILRGVHDYYTVTDQSLWYPNPAVAPAGLTSGQTFNVFNLDPYVWFVHRVQEMSAYGFSVDDDVANPTATGPLLAADGSANHYPNKLQIAFGGTGKLGNPNQWFPTTPWGGFQTSATIGVQQTGRFAGSSVVTFTGPDALRLYNQINNPGDGQVGAGVSAPGYIPAGTTLIFKGPTSGALPQIVLSQPATSTSTPITVTISAATPSNPTGRFAARRRPVRPTPVRPARPNLHTPRSLALTGLRQGFV